MINNILSSNIQYVRCLRILPPTPTLNMFVFIQFITVAGLARRTSEELNMLIEGLNIRPDLKK
jgi:hypothetical protein